MTGHGEALRTASEKDDLLVFHMQHEPLEAELSPQDRAMLTYAIKLNATPMAIAAADVQALRDAGFDERAVVDIVLIVAKYNFMNRLADGLGVAISPGLLKARERGEQRARALLAQPVSPRP